MPLDPALANPALRLTPGEDAWRQAVDKVLKGRSFETLRTPTRDGFKLEPIYPAATEASPIASRRGAGPWGVVQRIDHPDASESNRLALADLDGGASGLDLVFAGSPHARGYGIAADADIAVLLNGVMPDLIAIRLDAGAETGAKARAILEWAAIKGIAVSALDLTIGLDPVGLAARSGGTQVPLTEAISAAGLQAAALASVIPSGAVLVADGRIWHEAGASRVETLAAMLATSVAYWRALETAGLAIDAAADRIGFTLAVDQSQFSAMAEIRAFRALWARATEAAGIRPSIARIHSESSLRMMSRLDDNTNMIRTTLAAFAAGVGGADSVTVLPYSAADGLPDAFARRIARNTQLILQEEAHLARVCDPAAGSGRIETETRGLTEAAWDMFRQIEARGGIAESLTSGYLQERIAATATARRADIARRKEPITGASAYAAPAQGTSAVIDLAPIGPPAPALSSPLPPLSFQRLSEPFERLRASADPASCRVFLANLGTVADFGARSTWTANLLLVGGITTLTNDGFLELDEMVATYQTSDVPAVCLIASDAIYAAKALDAVAALKAAGAGPILFAGRPGDGFDEASLRAAGVDQFLFAGQDVLAALSQTQALLLSIGRALRDPMNEPEQTDFPPSLPSPSRGEA